MLTSNYLEKLDAALIRLGRIDMRVELTYTIISQIRKLFNSIYSLYIVVGPTKESSVATDLISLKSSIFSTTASATNIKIIAEQFANMLPENIFTFT